MTRGSQWIGPAVLCAMALATAAAARAAGEAGEAARLDPKRSAESQARAAARAGDFRVARTILSHMDENGHLSYGEGTPGLACDGILSDPGARDLHWDEEERRFARAYNEALLADPRYPDRDVCVPLARESEFPWRESGDAYWADFSKRHGRPLRPEASVNRAARSARPDLVRAQIAAGRPFDAWDRWHRRPLHWAARRGDLATLDVLIEAGARTDAREPASAVLLAADAGRGDAVERLLAAGASPFDCGRIDSRQSWGNSVGGGPFLCPLRQAIERGFTGPVAPLVKAVLGRGAYHQREELGLALYRAADLGRADLVHAFLGAAGPSRNRYLKREVMKAPAYRRDSAMLRTLLSLGGGWAARTPAEERLWLEAAKLPGPEPLALLVWYGFDLNYLTAADRSRLEAALPGLTAAELRPFLVLASEAREKAWDAVLAGNIAALDALAAAGVDFAERRGDTALTRAAGTDPATLRWMLAHGARPDTFEPRELRLGCGSSGDADEKKLDRTRREAFAALCDEQQSRGPKPRPQGEFGDHALAAAVRAGDPASVELLLPLARPEAALEALDQLVSQSPARPWRLPLLTRLAALAAGGDRTRLASALSQVLEKNDTDAALAILAGYMPSGGYEVRYAASVGHGPADECRTDRLRFLRDRGVDLSAWRDFEEGNLFARAARCDSAEFVAFAATVRGIGVNDIDYSGNTPLESLPEDKRDGEAGKAMAALGARTCEDLHGNRSALCNPGVIAPDPAL